MSSEQYENLEIDQGHPMGEPPKTWSRKKLYVIGGLAGFFALLLVIIFAATAKPRGTNESGGGGGSDPGPVAPPVGPGLKTGDPSTWPGMDYRIPDAIIPDIYNVTIDTDFDALTFSGVVEIQFHTTAPVSYVPIHANKMTILSASLATAGNGASTGNDLIDEVGYLPAAEFQQFVMKLKSPLPAGNAVISLRFEANLTSSLAGYYLSTYQTKDGKTEKLATTQFEPTDARAAFPCWDEPAKKAVFYIRLMTPKDYTAIANGKPVAQTDVTEDRVLHTFEPSPKMSTYLVAYCVFKFGKVSGVATKTQGKTNVAVWSRPDELSQTNFALKFAQDTLAYYETLFQIPFPLPKTDLVAIPDFAAGAMENWGLITYRESDLLFDATQGSSSVKQRVATVIAHELAHQWFGNLVTMKWWDDLWLNEGFASVIEYMGVANEYGEDMDMNDQFLLLAQYGGFKMDALSTSHPIHVPVKYPYEINSIFDSISYDKGASVLRMLRDYLGSTAFFAGLKNYLTANAYSNADTNELWRRLQPANDANVANITDMMNTWVTKAGYPVVEATVNPDANGGGIKLTQYPFTYLGQPGTPYLWQVPVQYLFNSANTTGAPAPTQQTMLLSTQSTTVPGTVTCPPSGNGTTVSHYFKLNAGASGFYITAYDRALRQCLITELNQAQTSFSPADRAGILQDGFRLTHSGTWSNPTSGLTYRVRDILAITTFLAREKHYVVWAMAELGFGRISTVMGDSSTGGIQADFNSFVLGLARARIDEALAMIGAQGASPCSVTWPQGATSIQRMLYASILSLAAHHGDPNAVAKMTTCFNQFQRDNTTNIDPDIRRLVYSVSVAKLGSAAYELMYKRYKTTTVVSERIACLYALASARERPLMDRTFSAILDGTVRSQDAASLLGRMAYNPAAQAAVWDFIQTNWLRLAPPDALSGIGSEGQIIKRVLPSFTTQAQFDEAKKFFTETYPVSEGKKALQNSLEYISANIRWQQTSKEDVIAFCKQFNS